MSIRERKHTMTIGSLILIICYMTLTVSGLVLFKLGSQRNLSLGIENGTISARINVLVLLGMLFYVCSFLLYLVLVSRFDLSYIMPISTGMVAILTIVAASVIFHETITVIKVVGIAMVIVGTILINLKK